MTRALPFLLLTACGSAVQVSPCGLSLFGESPTFDVAACDAVRFVSEVYGAEATERVASRLAVVVNPAALVDPDDAGETFCESGRLVLDSDDWYPGALAHELAHGVECPASNVKHEGWNPTVFAAVDRFHAEALR